MPLSKTDPLLREAPNSPAYRPLVNEPLTAEDWGEVYRAMLAFRTQVRLIVVRARQRSHRDRA